MEAYRGSILEFNKACPVGGELLVPGADGQARADGQTIGRLVRRDYE